MLLLYRSATGNEEILDVKLPKFSRASLQIPFIVSNMLSVHRTPEAIGNFKGSLVF